MRTVDGDDDDIILTINSNFVETLWGIISEHGNDNNKFKRNCEPRFLNKIIIKNVTCLEMFWPMDGPSIQIVSSPHLCIYYHVNI